MVVVRDGVLRRSRGHAARPRQSVFAVKIRVTNRLGLPQAIVQGVVNDPYDAGDSDYTVTGLLKPARAVQLEKGAEIVEDAADRIHSLQGQVMHQILERMGPLPALIRLTIMLAKAAAQGWREGETAIQFFTRGSELARLWWEAFVNTVKWYVLREFVIEERFFAEYEVDGKKFRISAQVDLFDPKTGVLSDYKYTSVGAAKRGLKEDHRLQLNVQAELLRKAGYMVNQAEVVLLLRDWSAERSYEGYPSSPSLKQVVQFMSSEEVDAWVVGRIRAHEAAKHTLPDCTPQERWNRPTFAVMKSQTAARATRVKESRSEAEALIATEFPGHVVVERPGEDVRCLRYCPARSVCEYAKSLGAKNNTTPPDLEDGMMQVK